MMSIVMISWFNKKSDLIGMIGSGLCLAHCVTLPVLLSWGALSGLQNEYLEIGFLLICLGAVWKSSLRASVPLGLALWLFFAGMAFGIWAEGRVAGAEELLLGSSVGLVLAHGFNLWRKYSMSGRKKFV